MSPTTQTLIDQLTPIADRLFSRNAPEGVDADELRYEAQQQGVDLDYTKPSIISAALTASLRAANGKPTAQTRKSMQPTARGRRVLVWVR